MQSAVAVDRLQFAFTVTFHYIFPQLTMGLALLIVIMKTLALRTGDSGLRRWPDMAEEHVAGGIHHQRTGLRSKRFRFERKSSYFLAWQH